MSLLYANVSPDDILLKQKLDILVASHPNLKVYYTVVIQQRVGKEEKDTYQRTWQLTAYLVLLKILSSLEVLFLRVTYVLVAYNRTIDSVRSSGMMKHISGDKAKDRSQGELTGILKDCALINNIEQWGVDPDQPSSIEGKSQIDAYNEEQEGGAGLHLQLAFGLGDDQRLVLGIVEELRIDNGIRLFSLPLRQ
ncbi:hypothetical protein M0R45_006157 [Rubus argutus]